MTRSRIKAFEVIGFVWHANDATWAKHLCLLADFQEKYKHCHVLLHCDEYPKLHEWASNQRRQYKLYKEGKYSPMNADRENKLEALGFEWISKKSSPTKKALATSSATVESTAVPGVDFSTVKSEVTLHLQREKSSLIEAPSPATSEKEVSAIETAEREFEFCQETGGSASKPPPRLPVGGVSESESTKLPRRVKDAPTRSQHLQPRRASLSHHLFLYPTSYANDASITVPNQPSVAASDAKGACPAIPTPDKLFESDPILSPVELELLWLGEESLCCFMTRDFQFDFIYEYASVALKAEIRKLSEDDSESGKVKQIVRMDDWLVARRFAFVRAEARLLLGRGFRRDCMRLVIAELRLLQRKQAVLRFPPMIILDQMNGKNIAGRKR